jgi:2'-5' RNA ligase
MNDPATPRHRLFFAIEPEAHARAELAALVAALRTRHGGAGWVDPAKHHATLVFLGEWALRPDAEIARAIAVASGVRAAAFDARFDSLDAFAAGARPVWILRAEPAPWQPLVVALRRGLEAAGLGFDTREFVPHLTLRRAHAPPDAGAIAPIRWRAQRFALLHGATRATAYERVGEWPLGPPE